MTYHVFIERARDPGSVAQVAAAIAKRYGLPHEAIAERMARGRFRVKANVDLQTARSFAADLQSLGAVCSVVDAATARTVPASGTPRPEPKPKPAPPDSGEYASGLSAAYGDGVPSQELGALESGEFKLSSIDGADELPTSFADVATPTPAPGPAADAGGDFAPPADAFAPPEEETVLEVEDTPAPRATPRPMAAQRAPEALPAEPAEAAPAATARAPKKSPGELFREHFLERPKVRFAAGVALVVVLSWVPAAVYFGSSVDGAQAELNVTLQETVTAARKDDTVWADFDDIVRKERDLTRSRLFNKRITAVLLWLGVGGVLGYVYFRKIPWDDL